MGIDEAWDEFATDASGLDFEPAAVERLERDLRRGVALLGAEQIRYFVDMYYSIQMRRMQAANQMRNAPETTELATWLFTNMRVLETELQKVLGAWASAREPGIWLQSITGIGPVISAGLLAHIDISKVRTAGAIWRFAGLDPSVVWAKGTKRPWNADLKRICWNAGASFVKLSGRDDCVYGHLYRQRKALEVDRNERGMFAEEAARTLQARKIEDKATLAYYRAGKLPPGRIDLRARRVAVKLLLAHLFDVLYQTHFHRSPPRPWVFAHGGGEHIDYFPPPNWPLPN